MKNRTKLIVMKITTILIAIMILLIPFYKITLIKGEQQYHDVVPGILFILGHLFGGNLLLGFLLLLVHILIPYAIYKLITKRFQN